MRLDKYLKVSRLIKRRTVANEACDAGRVMINDKPAKASSTVKAGDVITMLGTLPEITPEVIEGLFVADMEFLQDMYDTINKADKPQIQVTCPHCGEQFVDTINFQGAG